MVGQRTLSIRRASQRLAIPNLTASHESIRLRGETPAPISSPLRRSPSMCTAHSIVARSAAHPRTGQPRMYGVRTPRPGTTGRTGTGQNYSENVALSWYGSALIGMGVDTWSASPSTSQIDHHLHRYLCQRISTDFDQSERLSVAKIGIFKRSKRSKRSKRFRKSCVGDKLACIK